MKKTIIALSILGAMSGIAQAQSSVSIYGIADAGVVREMGGANGNATNISSGIGSASRLGFRGTESIGNGVSVLFVLESGVRLDTGANDVSGTLFNRQAYVGLKSSAGTLSIGRQYTPFYNALSQVADPFGAGYAGASKNLIPTAGTRTSNAVVYASPVVNGFSGEVSYSLAELGGSSTAGRQFGAALSYGAGKLNARLAHHHRNNDTVNGAGFVQDRGIGRNTLIAANYNFGVFKGFLAYGVNEGVGSSPLPNNSNPFGGIAATASTDSSNALIGVTVPFGANVLMASFIRKNDETAFNQDADQWALGLSHSLTKRTSLYTSYGKIRNRNGAGYTVGNNSDVGSGDAAFNAGIRHTF